MKRAFPQRRSSSSAQRRPTKKQKVYSTRHPSWDEQRSLGGIFAQVGEGAWPVKRILAERVVEGGKQYQLEWYPHPETFETYQPTWTANTDVADDLIRNWTSQKIQDESTRASRKARSRRVIPDSSSTAGDTVEEESDAAFDTTSFLSDSSASFVGGIEPSPARGNSRTQLVINSPEIPVDTSQYATLSRSQGDSLALTSSTPSSVTPEALKSRVAGSGLQLQDIPISRNTGSGAPSTNSTIITETHRTPPSQRTAGIAGTIPVTPDSLPTRQVGLSGNSARFVTILETAFDCSTSRKPETQHSSRLSSPFEEDTRLPTRADSPHHQAARDGESGTSQAHASYLRSPVASPKPHSRHQLSSVSLSAQSPMNMASTGLEPNTHHAEHVRSPLVNSFTHDDLVSNGRLYDEGDDADEADEADISAAVMIPPLPIMPSIEAEVSEDDAQQLLDSKANHSQESLNNVREVETVDGIMIPVRPILGPHEYVIDLPAEGKVKSAYDEVIKIKKKSVLKFISRRGAPGTSDISNKKTLERNEMQDMLQRLHDTVTHTDLGLPLSQTQYELNEEENAAYAEYAGSKFVMLGYLIDRMRSSNVSIAVFAQAGQLQDLLQEYLNMKRVTIRRHDRGPVKTEADSPGFCIDLFPTPSNKTVTINTKPQFVIAFDVSFDTGDAQLQSLRQQFGQDLPIIHFLVANSSEHVERCVPVWLTSNIRLKVVVRTTYLASPYLGGDIKYYPQDTDEPVDGSLMTMSDYQRAIRKSPDRKMSAVADIVARSATTDDFAAVWTIDPMPELQLAEFHSPPKMSRAASRTPQPRTARNSAPNSRATTPVSRKRLLEPETENGGKRLRMTPVRDLPNDSQISAASEELTETRKSMAQLSSELDSTRQALAKAQEQRDVAESKATQWQDSLAELQHRYERNKLDRLKMAKENKRLESQVAAARSRTESTLSEKAALRDQIAVLKAELEESRIALKAEGGHVADLEIARSAARTAAAESASLQKSLNSVKTDFEFTRTQYQEASRQAGEMAAELQKVTAEVEQLKIAADDRKRQLKAMDYEQSLKKTMDRAEQFKLECRARDALIKKMQEDLASMKSRRGVTTRGNSVQPAPSPNPRSRQASPATGHLSVPPSGSRASVLRHER